MSVSRAKKVSASLALLVVFSGLGAGTASAVKPAQGSTFTPGTCTTTTGHGTNATQETDPGQCTSADNDTKHTNTPGTNTGHGFVAD